MKNKNLKMLKLCQTALFAALCFVAFAFFQIRIPLPGGYATSIHVGNVFCVLASLLLGGLYGGLAGAIGMTLADLIDPVYFLVAPKTFVMKLCIGLLTGAIAHNYAKINNSNDKKYILKWSILSSSCGLAFNIVFNPIIGYFYKQYILGQPQKAAAILTKIGAFTTFFNSVLTIILAVLIYNAILPIFKKSGFLIPTKKENSQLINK